MRPSVAARRSDSRRDRSAWMNPSPSRPSSARPRHNARAAPSSRRASADVAGPEGLPSEPAQALELRHVERTTRDVEHVPRRSGAQGRGGRLERCPEPADVAVDDGRYGRRRLISPDGVDQALGRDHLARVEQQERQHGALLRAAERQGSVAVADFKVAEQTELRLEMIRCGPAIDRLRQGAAAEPVTAADASIHAMQNRVAAPPDAGGLCAVWSISVAASCDTPVSREVTGVRHPPVAWSRSPERGWSANPAEGKGRR